MDCYEFQDKVSVYIEKELTLSDVNRFDTHLDSCKGCSAVLAGVRSAVAAVRVSERFAVSSGFNNRLFNRLKVEKVKPVSRIGRMGHGRNIFGYQPRYAFASLAAVALIIVLTVGILPKGGETMPVQLSTQQGFADPAPKQINSGVPLQPSILAEDSEEDSLETPGESRRVKPGDFGGKIQLVKDKKR
ncbi:MAG: hypothetical protein CMG71_08420 [Candidatus Marinimicrobia bacterium]|nr:hypothetical protein [Candidatus Neomarinimicrobiota bacterium]|tara:strand:+ start:10617 stop:11180 length:564 start_codon:yes stop_codon:yes gene_type:complete